MIAFLTDFQLSIRDCGWERLNFTHNWKMRGCAKVGKCRRDSAFGQLSSSSVNRTQWAVGRTKLRALRKSMQTLRNALGAGRRGKNGHRPRRAWVSESWHGARHSMCSKEASILNLAVQTHAQRDTTSISRSLGFPLGIFLFAFWEFLAH